MNKFTTLELLPKDRRENLLVTLRHYAAIIEKECGIGQGQERDSFHYVEQTYFLWEYNDCVIRLFWSDEEVTKDWLWLTIDCNDNNADDLALKLLEGLKPYLYKSEVKFSR
jgi:hypothetical protein